LTTIAGYSGGRRDPVSQAPSTFVDCPTRLIVDTVPSHTNKGKPHGLPSASSSPSATPTAAYVFISSDAPK